MGTVTVTAATGAMVRAWAIERGYAVGTRGRFSAELIAAFNKAHRKYQYGS